MMKLILTVLVSAGFLAAANAQVNFDQGVNVNEFISQAHNSDLVLPAVGRGHYSRDCARFSFGPSATALVSEKVWLRSTEYVTECHTVMQPGPNGTMIPVQNCYDRPGMSWSQAGQIKIEPRALLPWERESFEICMQGPWLDLYVNAAGYKYTARREGNYDTLFVLTPLNKIAMKADENGLSAGTFSYADGKYTFTVNDKWAKEYAGDKVAIKLDLYKDNPNWFDGYKGSKEFTFNAAEGYKMVFAASDMEQPEAPDTNREEVRGSKKFYVKWGFKRVGAVSKDNFVKKGETPSIDLNAPAGVRGAQSSDGVCTLAMDTNYSCIYMCKDGSYISKPNPFPGPSMPGYESPMHGCRPTVPYSPFITILN
ncbi:MAG: hypothetical protein Q7R35_12380 [Elusimicrobiota bacterium]|nr:hypothetical protein [Elusimicrobiota bacterium]